MLAAKGNLAQYHYNLVPAALNRGDIGAVVHCYAEGKAYEVEFVTGEGKTIAVVTLESKDVRPMHANEILHVRGLRAA